MHANIAHDSGEDQIEINKNAFMAALENHFMQKKLAYLASLQGPRDRQANEQRPLEVSISLPVLPSIQEPQEPPLPPAISQLQGIFNIAEIKIRVFQSKEGVSYTFEGTLPGEKVENLEDFIVSLQETFPGAINNQVTILPDRNTRVKNHIEYMSQLFKLPDNYSLEVDGDRVTFHQELPQATIDDLKFTLDAAFNGDFFIKTLKPSLVAVSNESTNRFFASQPNPPAQPVVIMSEEITIKALTAKLTSLNLPGITLSYKENCCSFQGEITEANSEKLKTEFASFLKWYKPNGQTIALDYSALKEASIPNPTPIMSAYAQHGHYQAAPTQKIINVNIFKEASQAQGISMSIPLQGDFSQFLKDVLFYTESSNDIRLLGTPINTPSCWSLSLDGHPVTYENSNAAYRYLMKNPHPKLDICLNLDSTLQSAHNFR